MSGARRAAFLGTCGAATLAAATLLAPGEARASGSEGAIVAGVLAGTLGLISADIAFAAHDIDAAYKNKLDKDGWLWAEVTVAGAQSLFCNIVLLGFTVEDDSFASEAAILLGTIPTASLTALTVHGIWGLTDDNPPADANAGVSTLVGVNFALSVSAIGRTTHGILHPRASGIFELVVATPGTAIGIYESTFRRPQQGAWIALTAWSGALALHGLASAIVDGGSHHGPPEAAPEPPPAQPVLQKAARRWWEPATFTMAPTVLSDGAEHMPGVVAVGTF